MHAMPRGLGGTHAPSGAALYHLPYANGLHALGPISSAVTQPTAVGRNELVFSDQRMHSGRRHVAHQNGAMENLLFYIANVETFDSEQQ
jgi:hypothetical protein